MNIFATDTDPRKAARDLCDRHVPKMIVESAQMLCSVHPAGAAPYRRCFVNHPCTLWTAASVGNYMWLVDHADEMCREYSSRWGSRTHKTQEVIAWARANIPSLPDLGVTPFAMAMPDQYKSQDPVHSYRLYYCREKSRFAHWADMAKVPRWYWAMCRELEIGFRNSCPELDQLMAATEAR